MASEVVYVRLCVKNQKAIRALKFVADFVAEKCEKSWNPEDEKVLRAMRYAVKHLTCETGK